MTSSFPGTNLPQLQLAKQVFAEHVKQAMSGRPAAALILGTGMGCLADEIRDVVRISYSELPGFATSTIQGHQGELLAGKLGGRFVVAMNGRSHLYEGHSINQIRYPILFFHSLGIKNLIVGNAAGGINPKFKSGQVMLIDDHLDLLFRTSNPLSIAQEHSGDGFCEPVDGLLDLEKTLPGEVGDILDRAMVAKRQVVYCPSWIEHALEIGRKRNLELQRGVYAALTGPNYETRSEYRMLKRLGADVVGMSTIPESAAAAELGMNVCGLSTITNVANPDVLSKTTHDEVIKAVQTAEVTLRQLMIDLVASIGNQLRMYGEDDFAR